MKTKECWTVTVTAVGTQTLDKSESIQAQHLNEAINYRMLDRQMWT